MNIKRSDFETLFHRKWSIVVLAELKRQGGSKLVTLQNRLNIGPSALRQTLEFLIEREVVVRNPGYGHPMRPEYILTDAGRPVAEKCKALVDAVEDRKVLRLLLMKWALPTLLTLSDGGRRFNELRESTATATSRALSLFLKEAQAAGVVDREVTSDYPPSAEYQLSTKAKRLAPFIQSLAG